jgi:hypothetical protein
VGHTSDRISEVGAHGGRGGTWGFEKTGPPKVSFKAEYRGKFEAIRTFLSRIKGQNTRDTNPLRHKDQVKVTFLKTSIHV